MKRVVPWMPFVFAVAVLPAQEQTDREALSKQRQAVWKRVEAGEPLIELKWRRDAVGDFEYAVAGREKPEWKRWFGKKLEDVVAPTGVVGFVAPLANPGDLVALTDGERHLRRIGVAVATADLAAFVRTPLPEAARGTALLDRMVAIDVLRSREDADAKAALARLAADASLPKQLADRAAGAPPDRRRLEAATWPLPATTDVVVVLRPSRLPPMRWLLDLGRFSGYVSSARVLTMLKQPREDDYVIGEVECETIAEFPFEVARRIGNHRCDEIGLALRMPREAQVEVGFALCAVGEFDVGSVVAGAAAVPMRCERDGDAAKLVIADGEVSGALVPARLDLRSKGVEVAPRPDVGKHVLANADAVLVAHVPEQSQLLAMAAELGVPGIQRADLAVTLREKEVLVDVRLGCRDADGAKAVAAAIREKLKELGWVGFLASLAIAVDESLLSVEPEDAVVHASLPVPRAGMAPRLEELKAKTLKQFRRD